jgi:dTDP-glucose pyrophosphorylase
MLSYFMSPRAPKFKALILAGGRGLRLGESTRDENKCLFRFDGKALIQNSLEHAVESRVDEIVVVVGYLAERVIGFLGGSFEGIPIKYVIQREQLGVVHAMECGESAIGDSDFILLLGDEFFVRSDHRGLVGTFRRDRAFAVCGAINESAPQIISKTYAIVCDSESRRIIRLIEKPTRAFNDLVGTGNIVFRRGIFEYIATTPINRSRGEKELADLIQCAVDDGRKVLYFPLAEAYVNVNAPDEVSDIRNWAGL